MSVDLKGCERALAPAFVACGSGAYAAPREWMSAGVIPES
jgi:hypothetical protein